MEAVLALSVSAVLVFASQALGRPDGPHRRLTAKHRHARPHTRMHTRMHTRRRTQTQRGGDAIGKMRVVNLDPNQVDTVKREKSKVRKAVSGTLRAFGICKGRGTRKFGPVTQDGNMLDIDDMRKAIRDAVSPSTMMETSARIGAYDETEDGDGDDEDEDIDGDEDDEEFYAAEDILETMMSALPQQDTAIELLPIEDPGTAHVRTKFIGQAIELLAYGSAYAGSSAYFGAQAALASAKECLLKWGESDLDMRVDETLEVKMPAAAARTPWSPIKSKDAQCTKWAIKRGILHYDGSPFTPASDGQVNKTITALDALRDALVRNNLHPDKILSSIIRKVLMDLKYCTMTSSEARQAKIEDTMRIQKLSRAEAEAMVDENLRKREDNQQKRKQQVSSGVFSHVASSILGSYGNHSNLSNVLHALSGILASAASNIPHKVAHWLANLAYPHLKAFIPELKHANLEGVFRDMLIYNPEALNVLLGVPPSKDATMRGGMDGAPQFQHAMPHWSPGVQPDAMAHKLMQAEHLADDGEADDGEVGWTIGATMMTGPGAANDIGYAPATMSHEDKCVALAVEQTLSTPWLADHHTMHAIELVAEYLADVVEAGTT